MRLKQAADFAVSLTQDTKSIKDLPQGADSLKEEMKQSVLKSLVGQLLYQDLTWLDLTFLISDLSRSFSKTLDERLGITEESKRANQKYYLLWHTQVNYWLVMLYECQLQPINWIW